MSERLRAISMLGLVACTTACLEPTPGFGMVAVPVACANGVVDEGYCEGPERVLSDGVDVLDLSLARLTDEVKLDALVALGPRGAYIHSAVGGTAPTQRLVLDGADVRSGRFFDIEGDGDSDVVLATAAGDAGELVVFRNDAGTPVQLVEVGRHPLGAAPTLVASGDLDGNGAPDLVVTHAGADAVSVLMANGAGSFAPATQWPTGPAPSRVAIGDLDRNGSPDLLTVGDSPNELHFMLQQAGTFTAPQPLAVGEGPTHAFFADMTADEVPDLVVLHDTAAAIWVFTDAGAGILASAGAASVVPVGTPVVHGTVVDVNRDTLLDFVVANGPAATFSIVTGAADGTFAVTAVPSVGHASLVAVADANDDDVADVVLGRSNVRGGLSVYVATP